MPATFCYAPLADVSLAVARWQVDQLMQLKSRYAGLVGGGQ